MCIQLNYKLYFRVDIDLDSISNIPGVAELVDAPDSRSGAARRAGSSPVPGSFKVLVFLHVNCDPLICGLRLIKVIIYIILYLPE